MVELALSDVGLRIKDSEVLKGVSLAAGEGTTVALLGRAGSGKTTLLRAIAGLAEPHAGTIRIGERTVFDHQNQIDVPPQQRGVGFMFQSDSLWSQWTVFENVAYCAQFGSNDDVKARTDRALELTGVLELADRHPPELTANDRRYVSLARALVCEPSVLLLDDPLSHLDGTARAESRVWLRMLLSGLRTTTLITTRDPDEAMGLGGHIVLLKGGKVEQDGTSVDLYHEPITQFAAEFMGQSNRLEGMLVANAGTRACIDVCGCQIVGITQTRAAIGTMATGVIRIARTQIGGGPGPNRIPMKLLAQICLGERWEVVFVRDALTVRAYVSAPLRHQSYHVEFPPDAMWVF